MFKRLLKEWDRLVFSGYGRIGLSGNLTLAQMIFENYPRIDERALTLTHFLVNASKSSLTKWLKN